MPYILGTLVGSVFNVTSKKQFLLELNYRSNKLKNSIQNMYLENLTTGTKMLISKGQIGQDNSELIISSSTFLLEIGLYRWYQTVEFPTTNIPDYIYHDHEYPLNFSNLQIGGQNYEIVNKGYGNLECTISADNGRRIFATAKATYNLLQGEFINLEINILDLTTNQQKGIANSIIQGPSQGDLITNVLPFITEENHFYKVSLNIINNGNARTKCTLIQHT